MISLFSPVRHAPRIDRTVSSSRPVFGFVYTTPLVWRSALGRPVERMRWPNEGILTTRPVQNPNLAHITARTSVPLTAPTDN